MVLLTIVAFLFYLVLLSTTPSGAQSGGGTTGGTTGGTERSVVIVDDDDRFLGDFIGGGVRGWLPRHVPLFAHRGHFSHTPHVLTQRLDCPGLLAASHRTSSAIASARVTPSTPVARACRDSAHH